MRDRTWLNVFVAGMLILLGGACHAQEEEVADPIQDVVEDDVPPHLRPGPAMYNRVTLLDESFPFDEEKPAVGHWHGNVRTGFGWPAASIVISVNEAGEYVISGSVTPGNRPHVQVRTFTIDGSSIEFVFPLDPPEAGKMRFTGTISEDGQRMSGEVTVPTEMIDRHIEVENEERQSRGEAILTAEEEAAIAEQYRVGDFELARSPLPMDLPEPMAYHGSVAFDVDVVFELTVIVAETPGGNWVGHIDIPSQWIGGWPLDHVEREGNHLMVHMGGGTVAVFDGEVSEDGARYAGKFKQLDLSIDFDFERVPNYEIPHFEVPAEFGPQVSIETEATIEHAEGHALAATLSVPTEGDGPFPCAILLTGQGGQRRDYRMFGHSMFDAVADHLTRRGIAVLRYDDRGFGDSTGQIATSTTADFATDAQAALHWAMAHEDIDASKIGFIGHDEGAVVAALAGAAEPACAFVVMLAGRGIPGYEFDLNHLPVEVQRVGLPEGELQQRYLDTARALLTAYVEGADDERLNALALEAAQAQIDAATALGLEMTTSAEATARVKVARLKQPWAAFHLRHDPAETMRHVDCPVLAIWGALDEVASVAMNRPPIEEAMQANGGAITVKVYDGLNHMLQPGEGDTPDDYRRSPVDIAEVVLEDIVLWIGDLE